MEQSPVILVVDDNAVNRKLIGAYLKGTEFKVIESPDGPDALEQLSVKKVDLILLDISMPVMSGIEVCRSIRANPKLQDLPVIAYTAHAMEHEKQELLREGFCDLLIKPISRNGLLDIIQLHLPQKQLLQGM